VRVSALARGVLFLAALGAAAAAWCVFAWRAALAPALGEGYALLLGGSVLSTGLATVAALRAGGVRPGWILRVAFVLGSAAWVLSLTLFPEYREPLVAALLGGAGGLLGALVLVRERLPREPRGRLAFLDPLLFGLALVPVLAEGALLVLDRALHPLLLADMGSARSWIETARLPAGKLRFGARTNSRGYCDGEPPEPGAAPLVTVIGDSFGVGAVPIPLHYTAVAERELGGAVELYNMGIVGADPRHYLELLRDEALVLRPDVVVVGVFVGNDLVYENAESAAPGLWHRLFDRESRLVARLIVRATRLLRERSRAGDPGGPVGRVQGEEVAEAVSESELLERFPWFADPLLEQPTFSRAGFLKLETERAHEVTAPDAEYPALEVLRQMKALAGEVPLLILGIPDEFQVEDALWEEIGSPGVRDRPQAVLARFCQENGIGWIDALPALRAVPPLADGERHLYQLQDTHWNVRGNAVAGRVLAEALRPYLGP
jgi:hypothetical protein